MNLSLDCHEPGYQKKVFTLCQSLTPISCKQGNHRFLTTELVKRQLIKARFDAADLIIYSLLFLNIRISDATIYIIYIYIYVTEVNFVIILLNAKSTFSPLVPP